MPVRLTEQGAVVVPPSDDDGEGDGEGSGNPLQPLQDLLGPVNQAIQQLTDDLVADGLEETLGIRIEALDHREDLEGAVGERTAEGVSITVDLGVLRGYLDPLLDVVPIGDLLGAIPEDESGGVQQVKGLVFELLGLAPKVQYVVGSGFVAASASPAFEMPELAPPPPAPPPPPVTGGTTTDTTVPSSGVSLPPPTSSGTSDVPAASVAPPPPARRPWRRPHLSRTRWSPSAACPRRRSACRCCSAPSRPSGCVRSGTRRLACRPAPTSPIRFPTSVEVPDHE